MMTIIYYRHVPESGIRAFLVHKLMPRADIDVQIEETNMPLVRIDLAEGQSADYRSAVADEVYKAMTTTMNVPVNDRFMVINEHKSGNFIADPTYLGIERSPQCIIVQLTLNAGRDITLKKAFYQALSEGLHARVGLRREDLFVSLVEVPKENWSFGNGEAQYAQ
jgi:4-oxalocrotonate tautomerase